MPLPGHRHFLCLSRNLTSQCSPNDSAFLVSLTLPDILSSFLPCSGFYLPQHTVDFLLIMFFPPLLLHNRVNALLSLMCPSAAPGLAQSRTSGFAEWVNKLSVGFHSLFRRRRRERSGLWWSGWRALKGRSLGIKTQENNLRRTWEKRELKRESTSSLPNLFLWSLNLFRWQLTLEQHRGLGTPDPWAPSTGKFTYNLWLSQNFT